MFLAGRNLLQNKTRFGLSVLGVSLAVMLILLLTGLRAGVHRQVGRYLAHTPGSVVVAQEGVTNLTSATSLLPPGVEAAVASVDGVASTASILSQFVVLELHAQKQPAYLVGYDRARGGGPWDLSAGREPEDDGEAVFDRVLADRHGLRTGDRFQLLGRTFTLVGLSRGTSSWIGNYVFVRKTAAEALLAAPGGASFVLVTPAPGVSDRTLVERLGAVPGTNALTKGRLIANDRQLLGRIFNAPLLLMVGIAFFVGVLVVGLVMYTATAERRREYGMLKAVGAEDRTLYAIVLSQALIATFAGSVAGVLLAAAAGRLIMSSRPQFLVVIEWQAVLASLLAGLAIAALAALAPARVVARLAPADVFRG